MIKRFFSKYFILIALFVLAWFFLKNGNSSSGVNRLYLENDLSDLVDLALQPNHKHNYLREYNSSFLVCNPHLNLPKLSKQSLLRSNKTHRKHNYSKPASNKTHDSRIVRAVIFFFPIEKHEYFEYEFRWVYRSWIEMQNYEPAKWRTDLILFVQNDEKNFKYLRNELFFLNKLKCSFNNTRTSKFDKPMCTLIHYVPIKDRNLAKIRNPIFRDETEKNKLLKYEHLLTKVNIFSDDKENLLPFYDMLKLKLSKYGYLDSILMAFDGFRYFKTAKYDFLIRSDMDIFLTPFFGTWLPR